MSFMISKAFYEEYEATFFVLIHHTTTNEQLANKYKINFDPIIETMRNLFGAKPNIKNLRKFFRNPII